MRTLLWFRGKDLRLSDHAPLASALASGEVIPLFVLDPYFFSPERAKALAPRIQFLLESLQALEAAIARLGSNLLVVRGRSVDLVPELARRWKVDRVVAQRWSEPFACERDARIERALHVPLELMDGETLAPPESVRTQSGSPFRVFTPFSRALRAHVAIASPTPPPRSIPPVPADLEMHGVELSAIPSLADLGIEANARLLPGGEAEARARLERFVRERGNEYAEARDQMGDSGTSRLSQDLKFGTLSPRQVWHAAGAGIENAGSRRAFENELIWREFAYATIWDFPHVLSAPFNPAFEGFPWEGTHDASRWQAWVEGRTGYPVVDAASRELLQTGYVHNRARMVSASFLTKHLLVDYRSGEAHYLSHLVDGDWAINNMSWQWSAGSGCDPQPYFRVFNPMTQGKRFDPNGDYVRTWIPELARLETAWLHAPWTAPARAIEAAGIALGETYPMPVVDHQEARTRFLALATEHLKGRART